MFSVSYSRINTWHYCHRLYDFTYLKKIKAPQPVSLVFGSAIHRMLEFLYKGTPRQKLKRLNNGYSQLNYKSADAFASFWKLVWHQFNLGESAEDWIVQGNAPQEIQYSSNDPKLINQEYFQLMGFGANLLKHYYETHAAKGPFPIAVEEKFHVPLGEFRKRLSGVNLVGIFDQIWQTDQGYKIVDAKTGWRFYSVADAKKQLPLHKDFQLSLYSLAFRYLYQAVEESLVWYPLNYKRDANGQVHYWEPVLTFRTQEDHERALDRVESFVQGLSDENFERTDDQKKCTRCPYFEPWWGEKAFVSQPINPSELASASRDSQIQNLEQQVALLDPKFSQPRLKLTKKRA